MVIRQPRPGETCICSLPAKVVLIKEYGEVPSCQPPDAVSEVDTHLGQDEEGETS